MKNLIKDTIKYTDEEKIKLLKLKKAFTQLFKQIEEEFIDRIKKGEDIKNLLIQRKRSCRKFIDDDEAIQNVLSDYLSPQEIFITKVDTLTNIQKKLSLSLQLVCDDNKIKTLTNDLINSITEKHDSKDYKLLIN